MFSLDLETVAVVAATTFLVGLVVFGRVGRSRRDRTVGGGQRPPTGVGAALALALEGDLVESRRMLQTLIRGGGAHRADAIVALVAVLRVSGETERAEALVEKLAQWHAEPWIQALRVRLALDAGHLRRAAARAQAPEVPTDLAVAALARAGQWDAALDRYRRDVDRKARDEAVESALHAGRAAAAARAGDSRNARKDLKRALGSDDVGVAALAVAARLHPKPSERQRSSALLSRRLGAETLDRSDGISSPDVSAEFARDVEEVLEAAAARFEVGEHEEALGILRDHLDREPDTWTVRRAYARGVLDHGAPDDWRAELAELLRLLPEAPPEATRWMRCRRCDYHSTSTLFVCPRCDAIGTMASSTDGPRASAGAPAEIGARLEDLLVDLGPETPETPS